MPRTKAKTEPSRKQPKIQLSLTREQKAVISKAARLRQTTVSKFIVEQAFDGAQQILANQVHFSLPPERWQEFCEALDAPPRVIPALQALFREKGLFDEPGNEPAGSSSSSGDEARPDKL